MVAFFEMVQGFLQDILNAFNMLCSFVFEFVELILSGINLFTQIVSPFPYLLTSMVFIVVIIAVIKLILSLVGVII